MELYTPHTLWDNYDRRALPLNPTVLKERAAGSCVRREVYFNGEAAVDGCTRIYGVLFKPIRGANGGGVVYMDGAEAGLDGEVVRRLTDEGYTVLWVDYAGQAAGRSYTVYPHSLRHANYFENPDCLRRLPQKPKESCFYVWTTVMLRGFTFLEQEAGVFPHKIAYLGLHTGAFQVYKAAFLTPEAACSVTVFNGGYLPEADYGSDEASAYNAALENTAYAALVKTPMLLVVCSNPADNSADYMNELFRASDHEYVRLSVAVNCMDFLDGKTTETISQYLSVKIFGDEALPGEPILSAKNSEGALYFSVSVPEMPKVTAVRLYVAAGVKNGAYRNWRQLPLTAVGENDYFAKTDVYSVKDDIFAFVCADYGSGVLLSGEMLRVSPRVLGIRVKELKKLRLIYEADYGADDWHIIKPGETGERRIEIQTGAHGIEGVCSLCGSMSTFKPGDDPYRGERDRLLQLNVFMPAGGQLVFEATQKNGESYALFTARRVLPPAAEWQKVLITENELHSGDGSLQSWADVVCFTLISDAKLLLNSLIWI
ncbi:MAG: hypothetical protein LBH24_04335 [Clostridiales bacterium]|jgi:hypothetical protein|nr:hypothetical protein [Clostridiales bacterium]